MGVPSTGGISKGLEHANAIQAMNAADNVSTTTTTNTLKAPGSVQADPGATGGTAVTGKAAPVSPMGLFGSK